MHSTKLWFIVFKSHPKEQGFTQIRIKWMIVFDEELNNYAKLYELENLYNSKNFKILLEKQIKILKHQNSSYGMSSYTLENLLDNNNWFKFMDSFELFENLHNKLIEKNTKVNIKQLKI